MKSDIRKAVADVSIIIPAYNEEESLRVLMPGLLTFCESNGIKLIVVNDGSSDGTVDVLKKYSGHECFSFHSNKVNRGYGGAIKTGVRSASSKYVITIDADGQHDLNDVTKLFRSICEKDADMIVGSRMAHKDSSIYRAIGKALIRWFAKLLLPIHIDDINSGMKIYDTELVKEYIGLCPDHMAYSDIIAMIFISQKHLVLEEPINIKPRTAGVSTISALTAIETVKEILNIVVLFNPMRVFLPIAVFLFLFGFIWELPFLIKGMGVSVGAMLLMVSGLIFFFLGLMAEQLSLIRKDSISK